MHYKTLSAKTPSITFPRMTVPVENHSLFRNIFVGIQEFYISMRDIKQMLEDLSSEASESTDEKFHAFYEFLAPDPIHTMIQSQTKCKVALPLLFSKIKEVSQDDKDPELPQDIRDHIMTLDKQFNKSPKKRRDDLSGSLIALSTLCLQGIVWEIVAISSDILSAKLTPPSYVPIREKPGTLMKLDWLSTINTYLFKCLTNQDLLESEDCSFDEINQGFFNSAATFLSTKKNEISLLRVIGIKELVEITARIEMGLNLIKDNNPLRFKGSTSFLTHSISIVNDCLSKRIPKDQEAQELIEKCRALKKDVTN